MNLSTSVVMTVPSEPTNLVTTSSPSNSVLMNGANRSAASASMNLPLDRTAPLLLCFRCRGCAPTSSGYGRLSQRVQGHTVYAMTFRTLPAPSFLGALDVRCRFSVVRLLARRAASSSQPAVSHCSISDCHQCIFFLGKGLRSSSAFEAGGSSLHGGVIISAGTTGSCRAGGTYSDEQPASSNAPSRISLFMVVPFNTVRIVYGAALQLDMLIVEHTDVAPGRADVFHHFLRNRHCLLGTFRVGGGGAVVVRCCRVTCLASSPRL
ncbi:hypothetical protein GH714_044132 [Hevea brasiliensis]|uniref:Uncharacterized protein n=1 Tax=Hevea brasiliensis TaxID=3981 RepID=A0A6A6K296_HEVBR|nr:hypothetical protein GH714_044132 [Hevea brasiliensis]